MKVLFSQIAETIWQKRALQFGKFKLKINKKDKNLPLSPFYLNLRTKNNPKPGPLNKADIEILARCLWNNIQKQAQPFSFLVGVPNAGNHLVNALKKIIPQPYGFYFLPMVKTKNGFAIKTKLQIYQQARVVVVDDVLTKATTKLQAISVLEKAELKVKDIFIIIDRLQGGKNILEKSGYNVYSCCTIQELLTYYWIKKYIDNDLYLKCEKYLNFF